MKIKYRRSRNILLPPKILILCEGESEIIYLKGFQSEEKHRRKLSRVKVELYQPDDYSPYGLLTEAKKKAREAIKERYAYDQVWIVFDRDGHANIPKTFDEAYDANVKIAFSLICFEYWILLHFEKTRRHFYDCDSLVHYIEDQKYIIDYSKTNYYSKIKDLQEGAIKNALWLHAQNESDLRREIKIYNLPAYTSFNDLFIALQKLL